jgi:hypothetical protein
MGHTIALANAFLGLLSGMDSKEFYQLFLVLQ